MPTSLPVYWELGGIGLQPVSPLSKRSDLRHRQFASPLDFTDLFFGEFRYLRNEQLESRPNQVLILTDNSPITVVDKGPQVHVPVIFAGNL